MKPTFDDQDRAIVRERVAELDSREGPRVGDFVRFADGTLRRISYEWTDDADWHGGYQTSDGGSYYLGAGYISMSGSLYPCVPRESLELTRDQRAGPVWIFHHDHPMADNGVTTAISFRVYRCELEAPR